jgi:hypothetical protein
MVEPSPTTAASANRRGEEQTSQRNSCSPAPAPPRRIRPAIRWACGSDLARNGGYHPPNAIHRAQAVAKRGRRRKSSERPAPATWRPTSQQSAPTPALPRKAERKRHPSVAQRIQAGRSGGEVRPGPLVAKHSDGPGEVRAGPLVAKHSVGPAEVRAGPLVAKHSVGPAEVSSEGGLAGAAKRQSSVSGPHSGLPGPAGRSDHPAYQARTPSSQAQRGEATIQRTWPVPRTHRPGGAKRHSSVPGPHPELPGPAAIQLTRPAPRSHRPGGAERPSS